jgi:glycosyltransferase involved in cell wall biosynthesis
MKIHLWAPGFAGFGGGIGAFSRELAKALRDLGHDLRLIGKVDRPGTWEGFPLWGCGGAPAPLRTLCLASGAVAACVRHRPDLIISTLVNFGPAAHLARTLTGTPFLLVAHGVDVHEALAPARRAALRAADRIVAVSAWTRERVLGVGRIDDERVIVVPNTVDEERFTVSAGPEALRQRYKLRPGEKVVLTVARLDAREGYKGYDRILRAMPEVRASCGAVRFIVVGTGDDRSRLEAIARELGVADAVTFAGFVSDEELPDHYRLADVFTMPSTGEGFGIVFLEALSCGTPVLAGDRDGSVDALDGGELGRLVDPTDIGAIAAGIIGLLKQQGPQWWFERHALHDAVIRRFGRAAFREKLRTALCF